jgi:hypothetical protein
MQGKQFGKQPSGKRLERILKSPHYKDGKFQNLILLHNWQKNSMPKVLYNFFFSKVENATPKKKFNFTKTDLKNLNSKKISTFGWDILPIFFKLMEKNFS